MVCVCWFERFVTLLIFRMQIMFGLVQGGSLCDLSFLADFVGNVYGFDSLLFVSVHLVLWLLIVFLFVFSLRWFCG